MKNKILLFAFLLLVGTMSAQESVGIGTTTPNASAVLELVSGSKGLLIPRMSAVKRSQIVNPATGLMVYQTNSVANEPEGLYIFKGGIWKNFNESAGLGWALTGNNVFSTVSGNVGIGLNTGISEKLFLNGDMFINAPGGTLGNQLNSAELKLRGSNLGSGVISFLKPDSTAAASISYSSIGGSMSLRNNSSSKYMRFHPNGNIGIGTSISLDDAVAPLQIKGGSFIDLTTNHGYLVLGDEGSTNLALSNYEIQARNNATAGTLRLQQDGGSLLVQGSALVVATDGKVGIGDITPDAELDVVGNAIFDGTNPTVQLQNSGVDKGFFQLSGDNARIGTNSSNTLGKFVVRTGGGDRVFVNPNGHVGVGISEPQKNLDVAGGIGLFTNDEAIKIDGNTPFMQFYHNGTAHGFIQQETANLFIGVNNGKLKLDGTQIAIGAVQSTADTYKLAVAGRIICEELKVELVGNWPDYVFDEKYQLTPLHELKSFIDEHNHLPNIPKASEIEREGLEVGDMQKKMMEKIEELTLYIIQQQAEIDALKKAVSKN